MGECYDDEGYRKKERMRKNIVFDHWYIIRPNSFWRKIEKSAVCVCVREREGNKILYNSIH